MGDQEGSGSVRAAVARTARRPATRGTLRLALYAAYTLALLSSEALELDHRVDTGLLVLAAVLWIAMLGLLWRGIATAPDKRDFLVRHLGYPIGLLAAFLVGRDASWLLFFVLVVGYVLLLRSESSGHGFAFSFGLVVFVGVIAALSMVYFERDAEQSQLRTPGDAVLWAFASLLRINYGRAMSPVTDDGRVLATVVGICAVLAASLFTAQVVAWVVGSGGRGADRARHDAADARSAARLEQVAADVAALRLALLPGGEAVAADPYADAAPTAPDTAPPLADAGAAPELADAGAAPELAIRALSAADWPDAMALAARGFLAEPYLVARLGPDPVTRLAELAAGYGRAPFPAAGVALGAYAGPLLVGLATASAGGRCDLCDEHAAEDLPGPEPEFEANTRQAHAAFPAHGHVARVVVDPVVRGRGIAGRLLAAALDLVQQQGGGLVLLECQPGLGDFYGRHGFVAAGTIPDPYGPPALLLRADLPGAGNPEAHEVVAVAAPDGEHGS